MKLCKLFIKAQEGAVTLLFGICAAVILAMAGLGVDASLWYSNARELQGLDDAVTLSAVQSLSGSSTSSTITSQVNTELARNGYSNAGITVQVNYPPTSGTYSGQTTAIEVILTKPKQSFFASMFTGASNIRARSVAVRQTGGNVCVLSLDTIVADATYLQGNSTINMANCILASNSSNSSAITIWGSSALTAQSLYAVGGYTVGGSASASLTDAATTGATAITDPYSSLAIPSYSGCDYNGLSVKKGDPPLDPGADGIAVFCNGLSIGAKAVITMNPGIYIIDRGVFDVNGNATVTGTGVTIILTSSTGSGYATLNINGGATVTLSAPTSGTYAGILFYQDRRASGSTNRLNGGSTTNLTGVVYIPSEELEFTGGNTQNGSCTQIVAKTVTFTGSAGVTSSCTGTGVNNLTTPSVLGIKE